MKSKLGIVLLLLFVFNLDGTVLAKGSNINSMSSPDGVAVVKNRRRRRGRRHTQRRAKIYRISVEDINGGVNTSSPEPVTEPTMASPPPAEARPGTDWDGNGPGRPAKRSAPRIKPPTVQIKPPTR